MKIYMYCISACRSDWVENLQKSPPGKFSHRKFPASDITIRDMLHDDTIT